MILTCLIISSTLWNIYLLFHWTEFCEREIQLLFSMNELTETFFHLFSVVCMCVLAWVCVHVCTPYCACGVQKKALGTGFCVCTMWVVSTDGLRLFILITEPFPLGPTMAADWLLVSCSCVLATPAFQCVCAWRETHCLTQAALTLWFSCFSSWVAKVADVCHQISSLCLHLASLKVSEHRQSVAKFFARIQMAHP